MKKFCSTLFHISAMLYRTVSIKEKLNLEKGAYFKKSFASKQSLSFMLKNDESMFGFTLTLLL